MKKTKVITCLLTAALIAASFAGCGDSKSASTDESSVTQNQTQTQDQKDTMAKVVSMEGDTITVVLADMPSDNGGGGTPPDQENTTSGGAAQAGGKAPTDGAQPPSDGGQQGGTPPDAQSGTTPAAADGSGSAQGQSGEPRQGGGEITFSSDEVTYTLSDDVTVTKGQGDSAADIDLSEVTVDSVISITTTTDDDGNEVINSIRVME